MSAASEGPGRGSEFTVRLPVLAGEAPPSAEPAGEAADRAEPSLRMLVVEDNVDAAQSMGLLLGRDGHEVKTAGTGPEALELVEGFRPDVVLLDIGLPGMDGYEVASRLRGLTKLRGVPLIAISGYSKEEGDRHHGDVTVFDHHLVKPVEPVALQQLLATLARQNRC